MTDTHALYAWVRRSLKEGGVVAFNRETSLLFQEVTGLRKLDIITGSPRPVDPDLEDRTRHLVAERLAGVPLFRALGRDPERDLFIGPDVLEPRDDTDVLIELVASRIDDLSWDGRFADLGTGSGLIALDLLTEFRCATAVATDVSPGALEAARSSAIRPDRRDGSVEGRIEFVTGSWCEPLQGAFDFIVSNPPYIRSDVIPTLDPSVRDHDPHLALDGGADGLDAYRAILGGAEAHLKPGGLLALEIGYDQRADLERLAGETGWRVEEVRQDLGGRDRAVLLRPNRG